MLFTNIVCLINLLATNLNAYCGAGLTWLALEIELRVGRRPASSEAQPVGGATLEQPAHLLDPCVKNEEDQIADTSNSG